MEQQPQETFLQIAQRAIKGNRDRFFDKNLGFNEDDVLADLPFLSENLLHHELVKSGKRELPPGLPKLFLTYLERARNQVPRRAKNEWNCYTARQMLIALAEIANDSNDPETGNHLVNLKFWLATHYSKIYYDYYSHKNSELKEILERTKNALAGAMASFVHNHDSFEKPVADIIPLEEFETIHKHLEEKK